MPLLARIERLRARRGEQRQKESGEKDEQAEQNACI
jgi:hypothetical protein